MMDLLRQERNVPARLRQHGAVIVAIKSCIAVNPTHGFDKLYPRFGARALAKAACVARTKALRLNLQRKGKGKRRLKPWARCPG